MKAAKIVFRYFVLVSLALLFAIVMPVMSYGKTIKACYEQDGVIFFCKAELVEGKIRQPRCYLCETGDEITLNMLEKWRIDMFTILYQGCMNGNPNDCNSNSNSCVRVDCECCERNHP